ncbi:subtilisin-like serine endopeptidase family protein [Tasmannia lanceolata]|uniref:subtilisin-like serine endopeptidase family protein n=1 Tax=Tasmannia lanceolata TaxID=3420 RepID=UPI004064B12A
MATPFQSYWVLAVTLCLYFINSKSTGQLVHIVYLGHNHAKDPLFTTKSHVKLLSNVFASEEDAEAAMLYSYKHSFSGFAARLNSTQANTLANMERVISVFRSKTLRLHTTRSWDFMGLNLDHSGLTPMQLAYGDDIVVGIFDTGIWPESPSVRAEPGMGPIKPTWKGECIKGDRFDPTKACNRKLIGARYYLKGFESEYGPLNTTATPEYRSARDHIGHGTHTASTAVGSIVKNASFFGFGRGIARGGAPRARLAVYKICWTVNFTGRCNEADILAAFDDALHDGVHVISGSFGSTPPLLPFFSSNAGIGSFHATQMGVSVVFSAGNDGPDPSLVQNVAPWSICVAASSMDRTFPTQIILDGQISIVGQGFIVKQISATIVNTTQYFRNGVCEYENWTGKFASGKVILCFSTLGPQLSGNAALAVFAANGLALIYAAPMTQQIAQVDIVPTVYVDISQGTQILYYTLLKPSRSSKVQIMPSKTVVGTSPAPVVAYFSSRGPNSQSPNILKPDISAPGVSILAAWPREAPPAVLPIDDRSVDWNFDSGTSMSCPHVAGIVALLKSAHPDWSPAAIKSAMMTTAYTRDTSHDKILGGGTMKLADPFDIGAGHVNPLQAIDPGLIYDLDTRDYILFLCSIGYTQAQMKNLFLPSQGIDTNCPKDRPTDMDLNYPSIAISNLQSTVTVKRTLSNVGHSSAIYFVSVVNPEGVHVEVWPRILVFTWEKERISYHVTLTPIKHSQGRYTFGEIVWSDGYHHVRSQLVVRVNKNGDDGDNEPISSA